MRKEKYFFPFCCVSYATVCSLTLNLFSPWCLSNNAHILDRRLLRLNLLSWLLRWRLLMLMLILLLVLMLALLMLIGLHVCIRLRRAHSILFLRVVALVVVMVILGLLLVVLARVEHSG